MALRVIIDSFKCMVIYQANFYSILLIFETANNLLNMPPTNKISLGFSVALSG